MHSKGRFGKAPSTARSGRFSLKLPSQSSRPSTSVGGKSGIREALARTCAGAS